MLVCDARPRPRVLQTPEEIHIGKLLHLLRVCSLGNLLVVKQDPRGCVLIRQLLADERDVVTVKVSADGRSRGWVKDVSRLSDVPGMD